MAKGNPMVQWRFTAGNIIHFYGGFPSTPCLITGVYPCLSTTGYIYFACFKTLRSRFAMIRWCNFMRRLQTIVWLIRWNLCLQPLSVSFANLIVDVISKSLSLFPLVLVHFELLSLLPASPIPWNLHFRKIMVWLNHTYHTLMVGQIHEHRWTKSSTTW